MELLRECLYAKRIGITGHIRPDGDCVGSCLALYCYLKKYLPSAEVCVFLENPGEIFCEMKGFEDIIDLKAKQNAEENNFLADSAPFDVFFVLDSMPDRTGCAEELYKKAGKKINIDHHVSNPGCGDFSVVRPSVGSTCEVLYDLMECQKLDSDIAMALYIGMIHDTGVFQYSNTTPETLQKGAHLISFGFDFPRLIQETFYQKTYLQTQLLGRVLTESRLILEGSGVIGSVDRKTLDEFGAVPADLEGIVSQLRNIKGVHCAVFMYETEQGDIKVSLRSDEKVNVAEIAAAFGGGGHVRAAGCTMKGNAQNCLEEILPCIAGQLV